MSALSLTNRTDRHRRDFSRSSPDNPEIVANGDSDIDDSKRGKSKIQWIFFPHFFIERFHAGDEVKNKHLTFSYKRQGILSGMLKTHKLTQKIRYNIILNQQIAPLNMRTKKSGLWNHHQQLLTYSDPDCTTNCCESINSG